MRYYNYGMLAVYITNPLRRLLIDRNMSKAQLRETARSTVFKMANSEYVAMDVLVRVCMYPGCGMDDIVEIERQ